LGTGFTYQGRLRDGAGNPLNTTCDLTFSLWNDPGDGAQIGADSAVTGVSVVDGYFAALVNGGGEFGSSAFSGQARWLQIAVHCTADPGYTTLSPRQPLSAAPYALSLQPGAVISGPVAGGSTLRVNNSAASGIAYGLYGQSDSTGGRGVYGYASATDGWTRGVSGGAESTNGVGVYGSATATSGAAVGVQGESDSTHGYGVAGYVGAITGTTYGVHGQADSTGGTGVYGYASASTGPNYGVYGWSRSTDGYGVYGLASASSGLANGVLGRTATASGSGVFGWASAASGHSYGVRGQADSTDGQAVYGQATAVSGSTFGVVGSASSPAGCGVYGNATANSGMTYGVYGRAASPAGYGVYGWASAGSGTNYGVYGESASTDGRGIYGSATAASGEAIGVTGKSASTFGRGVYGDALAGSGFAYGVVGRSASTDGRGVYGTATASSGTTYGVYGATSSAAGYGGYFEGRLHAEESINATATPANHVAQILNTSTGSSPDVLALQVGYTGNPDDGINFVTFFRGDDVAVGSVEGNGSGGVTFKSGSGDYAEFLLRLDPLEEISPGDVVGVYNGQVTKATRGAAQVLVVSSAPLVLGNDPGEEHAEGYEKVAFLGQVAVRVRGPVAAGDWLVPSGREDGTAVAVAPGEISAEQFAQVLGQAWESSAAAGVKPVQAAVGLWRADPTVSRMVQQISDLEARIARLESAEPRGDAAPVLPVGRLLPGVGLALAGVAAGLCAPAGRRWIARRGGGR
jgi:hypothetical protein